MILHRLLLRLPPETAHSIAMTGLRVAGLSAALCRRRRARARDLPIDFAGLHFPNPIGLAAGLDKDAVAVAGLFALGFGAVEVGTLTPRPQPGNPRPRLFRLPEQQALINRMGFNNDGAAAAAARLSRLRYRPAPLGINIGKNQATPLEQAEADYAAAAETLAARADYLVVNVSSPNTPGLRRLQDPARLAEILAAVRARSQDKPIFLKIDPDSTPEAVDDVVDAAVSAGCRGLIATNTTISRGGGLSGPPLAPLAVETLRRAARRAAGRLALVASGGVGTADDVYARLRAGASLVQIYTAFIYQGPGLVPKLLDGLHRLLERDHLGSVAEAVGRDL